MKSVECKNCGSVEFREEAGFQYCVYCQSRFIIETVPKSASNSSIAINEDIALLLRKCEEDPANRRKYANLVLDLDPINAIAMKYLR